MDRARFDSVVLPRLLAQVDVDDAILEGGFSPAELDTIIWGCRLPHSESRIRLPDPDKLFTSLEMSIDDRPFAGDFWSALPHSDPELTPWLCGAFKEHRFRLLFRSGEARFRRGAAFDVDAVCRDDLRELRARGTSVVEYTYGWCSACLELAKMFSAHEVELEVLDRRPDDRLVIWRAS